MTKGLIPKKLTKRRRLIIAGGGGLIALGVAVGTALKLSKTDEKEEEEGNVQIPIEYNETDSKGIVHHLVKILSIPTILAPMLLPYVRKWNTDRRLAIANENKWSGAIDALPTWPGSVEL